MRKGQRFGRWKVLNTTKIYKLKDKNKCNPLILCKDVEANITRYVHFYQLLDGRSKGSYKSRPHILKRQKSNEKLHKYVHRFEPKTLKSHTPFRVVKSVGGKRKTFGYFKTYEEAVNTAKEL